MKRTFIFCLMIALMASITSCNLTGANPQKIFNKIGLNGNKIPRSFKQHFKEIRGQIANGSLTVVTKDNEVKRGVTATDYIEIMYVNMFENDIKGIKELASDSESQPIIDAGLEMFQYADEIYKNDFLRIAKMIDEGKPDEEIDAAIEELDYTKGLELDEKYNKVMDLLLPYADKNGVKYKIQKTHF